jgi:glycosyltransferase involved in cell wall biosynthesis
MEPVPKLVTVGIPIYKRLDHLPKVLDIVAAQDYARVELLVSDNGVNGSRVHDIVKTHYARPARVRQNASTVSMSEHFNQIINEAAGEFFVLLADDDEISPNYVSELVSLLNRHPSASAAMGVQETMDESGSVIRRSSESVPEILSGREFIRAVWGTHTYRFESCSTFLARTAGLKACGGFPDFWKGTGNDDALVVKLCIDNYVALASRCAFRKRFYDESFGYAQSIEDLATGIRDILRFIDTDPVLTRFARREPVAWHECRQIMVTTAWKTYYFRWIGMYRQRLDPLSWIKAGFALPFIPAYYKVVARDCLAVATAMMLATVRSAGSRT